MQAPPNVFLVAFFGDLAHTLHAVWKVIKKQCESAGHWDRRGQKSGNNACTRAKGVRQRDREREIALAKQKDWPFIGKDVSMCSWDKDSCFNASKPIWVRLARVEFRIFAWGKTHLIV